MLTCLVKSFLILLMYVCMGENHGKQNFALFFTRAVILTII